MLCQKGGGRGYCLLDWGFDPVSSPKGISVCFSCHYITSYPPLPFSIERVGGSSPLSPTPPFLPCIFATLKAQYRRRREWDTLPPPFFLSSGCMTPYLPLFWCWSYSPHPRIFILFYARGGEPRGSRSTRRENAGKGGEVCENRAGRRKGVLQGNSSCEKTWGKGGV